MAIKLVDELKAMGNFPIAHAEGINLVKTDGTEDNLQNLFDKGELGGGDDSVTLTQQEYEALTEEQKLDGLYYTYDTKRIYKNGVQYGASEPIPLTMEEYKALKEAGAIDEQQEYLIEADAEGILLGAEDIGYNNAVSNLPCTTVQGAIDKIDGKIEELNDSLVDISRMKIYTNVKQLGLESECSTVDIFKAMPNNSLAIIGTFPTVSDEYCKLTDKPINSYEGLLTIVKFNHARFSIEYKLSGGDTEYPNRMYVGNFAGSNPTTIDWQELVTMDKVGDNIIVTPHTQICSNITISTSTLNRVEIDVAKSGYTCIGILSLQDNHGSYTQFRGWYVENNKVVVHVLSGEPYNDYIILASLLYKKN